jgi:hypothetical protein
LEIAELLQTDRKTQVDIGRGRVDAQLYVQRPAEAQLRKQFSFREDLSSAAFQDFELGFGSFRGHERFLLKLPLRRDARRKLFRTSGLTGGVCD